MIKKIIPGASGYCRNIQSMKEYKDDQTPFGRAMYTHAVKYARDYKQIVRDAVFGRELVNRMHSSGVLGNSDKKL